MDKKSRELVMGKLYLKNKDYKMAEKSLLEYLNSSPEDFQALKLLAQVYEYIKDNSKAFDLYERCYLAQPERKGVLLDICRLLLLNDSRLDHVDQRKWLKLAIQTFPSNPIVMNLRDTLPINDYDPTPNKVTIENEIIDKLDRMEQRLVSIESMVADLVKQISIADSLRTVNLSDTPKSVLQPMPVIPKTNSDPAPQASIKSSPLQQGSLFGGFTAFSGSGKPVVESPKNYNLPSMSQWPSEPKKEEEVKGGETGNNEVVTSPNLPILPPMTPKTNSFPAPQAAIKSSPLQQGSLFGGFTASSGSGNPFAESLKKYNLPSVGQCPSEPKKVEEKEEVKGGETGNNEVVTSSNLPILHPMTPKTNSDPEPQAAIKSSPLQQGSLFGGFTACTGSGNLFAESLKKYNLPSVGQWPSEPKREVEKEEEEGGEDGDNEVVNSPDLPIENTCDMQPIEIRSGEEDEDIVFEYRCKLFRFRDKEYKERGLGNIKVLKHRTTGAGRLIMRRDLINLVCLNCWSLSKVERVRDTQVRFAGLDASDGEPEMTVFLAKFKTQEMTDKFITQLTELFPDDS